MSDNQTRGQPRFISETQVEIGLGKPSEFSELWTYNISVGGMFIRTTTPPPVGTMIEVRIDLNGHVMSFWADVKHVVDPHLAAHQGRPPGIGVRFHTLPPESRRAFEEYVENISRTAPVEQPAAKDDTSWVLGIDLGMWNTAAVACGPGSEPMSVIRGERHRGPVLPSVVSYKNAAQPVVGWPAHDMLLTDPLTTIYGWKRFIGRSERNEFVDRHRVRFPFRMQAGDNKELGAVTGSTVVSFIDVAAHVLAEVRHRARGITGRDVRRAVIAVPAHFSTAQRRAVYEAARRAELEVMRLVSEPTVAALSFGADQKLTGKLLIYDFGGGSFDVTLVEVEDNVFDAVCTAGDSFLGGLDLDRAVMERLVQVGRETHNIDAREEPVVAQRLLGAAENTKIALSTEPSSRIHIPMIGYDRRGAHVDLSYTMERDELERLTAPLVEKTIGIVEAMLERHGTSKAEIGATVLVGGQSHMPLVASRVSQTLSTTPVLHPAGDLAVARGAAIYAMSVGDIAAPVLLDTLAVGIGMMMPGGRTQWVFERGCPLPASVRVPIDRPSIPNLVLGLWEATELTSPDREMLGVARFPETLPGGELAIELAIDEELQIVGDLDAGGTRIPLRFTS